VHSARFAGPAANDAVNNEKLLQELHRRGEDLRARGASRPGEHTAHYLCVIALAERGKILTVVEGRAHGVILDRPRGAGGFGYDPLFFYPPLGKTFAELSPEGKFTVSHRGEAFRKLLDFLAHR
jgi:XTP/dITP diphosphohydrolase